MKYLLTGVGGFVGQHYLDLLNKSSHEVYGVARNPVEHEALNKCFEADLSDNAALKSILHQVTPDFVVHLASDSSVGQSWSTPVRSFRNNTNIFLNLVDSIRELNLDCRMISVGSSEQYGIVTADQIPLTEDCAQNPVSPYAGARVSQEIMSKIYQQSYGIDIVMTRSFNHIGTKQDTRFVVPSFIKQLISIKNDTSKTQVIKTGDLSIIRDFVDVRDVVRAYDLLLKKGKSGQVYNICSGIGTSLNDVLKMAAKIVDVEYIQETEPSFIRPNDNPLIIGSNVKLQNTTGWNLEISLENSLHDIVSHIKLNEN